MVVEAPSAQAPRRGSRQQKTTTTDTRVARHARLACTGPRPRCRTRVSGRHEQRLRLAGFEAAGPWAGGPMMSCRRRLPSRCLALLPTACGRAWPSARRNSSRAGAASPSYAPGHQLAAVACQGRFEKKKAPGAACGSVVTDRPGLRPETKDPRPWTRRATRAIMLETHASSPTATMRCDALRCMSCRCARATPAAQQRLAVVSASPPTMGNVVLPGHLRRVLPRDVATRIPAQQATKHIGAHPSSGYCSANKGRDVSASRRLGRLGASLRNFVITRPRSPFARGHSPPRRARRSCFTTNQRRTARRHGGIAPFQYARQDHRPPTTCTVYGTCFTSCKSRGHTEEHRVGEAGQEQVKLYEISDSAQNAFSKGPVTHGKQMAPCSKPPPKPGTQNKKTETRYQATAKQ